MAHKTALILMASDGSEDTEVVIPGDILARAGIRVTYASLSDRHPVKCSMGLRIVPETTLAEIKGHEYDCIVIPGGEPGNIALANCPCVGEMLRKQNESGRMIAAICAGPMVLASHKIPVERMTAFKEVQKTLKDMGLNVCDERVVVSQNVITSQTPGTCLEFSLKIVEQLMGGDKARELAEQLLIRT